TLSQGSGFRQAKADFPLVLLAPAYKHGSGTGDDRHGAIARRDDSLLLAPLERFLNLIVTGPNRIPFSHEGEPEMRVDRRWRTRKDEEGMGTTVAVQRRGWGTGSAEIG